MYQSSQASQVDHVGKLLFTYQTGEKISAHTMGIGAHTP